MNNQSGSIHAIIIGLLTVALLGSIGFIFWQNFVATDQEQSSVKIDSTLKNSDSKTNDEADETVKITYCAKFEKVCFDYPEGWSLKQMNKKDPTSTFADGFTVTSPDKLVVLLFLSGLGATSLCCGQTPEGPVSVVDVNPAPKIGAMDKQNLGDHTDSAYVSEVITSKVEAEYAKNSLDIISTKILGYYPEVVLHNSTQLSMKNTFQSTGGIIGLMDRMPGKYIGEFEEASVVFGSSTYYADLEPYVTAEEAKAQFKTESFQQAKEILLSARYK